MLPAEQARGEALVALARERFNPELRPIEERVLRYSCAYEDPADWTPDPTTPDPTCHETTGRPLPNCDLPAIRPTLLRWLLTDSDATALLEPRGLRVWNARLTDPLDLIGCTVPARLELRYCLVEAPVLLANASLPTLSLRNSTLQQTLDAPFLKLHGPLLLDDITAAETLNFNGATILAEVRIANTTLTATGNALTMEGASITNDLLLWPELKSSGSLYLRGIHVGGQIAFRRACLTTTDTAINLDKSTVTGAVYLTETFKAAGEIRMIGAHVGGQLRCIGANLTSAGDVLNLDGATVDDGVFLEDGFKTLGTVRMIGAHIGGQLSCRQAKLTAVGIALNLDDVTIDGSVFLRDGFEAAGEIRLNGAHVGGQLSCKQAKLTTTGCALNLDNAIIDQSVFLDDGFEAAGEIRLLGARLGSQFSCDGASIQSLVGENMEVRGDFFWTKIKNKEQTWLNLVGAKIKALRDDHASWPAKNNLVLNGLYVEDFSPLHARHLDITGRIAWLNRQPNSQLAEPQPWLHLAGHLEAKGHKRAAKRVIYELRKHQSRANWKNSRFKRLGYAWDTRFARLEQQPFFILVPILLLTTLSGTTFHAYRAHFAETSESAYKATHTPNLQAAPSYPKFQPYVYALENVSPIIKLGQDDKWAPDPAHTGTGLYRTLIWLRWFLILSGWVMGGILAAAVSARFRT